MSLVALAYGILALSALAGAAQDKEARTPASAHPPPSAAADPSAKGEPDLPRVLLIGDSISIGYTGPVATLLRGKAEVHRIPGNGGPTTNGLVRLAEWVGEGCWDVIHFNWGLHDLKIMSDGTRQVPLPEYEANLRELTRQLKATGATLIWASTTPVPTPDDRLQVKRSSADVPRYNAVAKKVMREYHIPINDLYAFALPRLPELQTPNDVHYTAQGYDALGRQVAEHISALLTNVFRDTAGVICMEAENFADARQWQPSAHYTGTGVTARAEAVGDAFVEYELQVLHPGTYRIYLLGNRSRNTPVTDNVVAIQVAGPGEAFETVERLVFQELNAPAWSNLREPGADGAAVQFKSPGAYRLRLAAERGQGFYVDKIVLTASDFVPTGTGPQETRGLNPPAPGSSFDPMVVLPPAWAFGVLYGGYTDQAQTLRAIRQLREAGFPVDAYWIDSWFWDFAQEGRGPQGYMNFVEDKTAFPNVQAMWDEFQKLGIKAGVWAWDCILREGNEETFDEFLGQHAFSSTYIEKNGWHNGTRNTLCGNINFEDPAAVALWRSKLAPFFDRGLDFLKIDRSSSIPFSRAAFEAAQDMGKETEGRGFILAHVHTTSDPRLKLYPTKWSGDAKIAWTQPDYPDNSVYAMGGFRENIGMVADPKRSTYAIPFLAHDAGGYDFFGSEEFSDELYVRWMQFSCLNSIMQVFSHAKNESRNHPYWFPEPVQAAVRKYTRLRMQLFPYLYTHALNTRLLGEKMVRGDGCHEYQYLLGDSLLVAPVCSPGATHWPVHLPGGRWIDWDTDDILNGGRTVTVTAPTEKLPLFVREGSVIPLRDYAPSIEAGSNDSLRLEVYPGTESSVFRLREDDGRSNDYLLGRIATTDIHTMRTTTGAKLVIMPVEGSFVGMKPDRQWAIRFHLVDRPTSMTLNGAPTPFSYDPATRILTVSINYQKDMTLTVESR